MRKGILAIVLLAPLVTAAAALGQVMRRRHTPVAADATFSPRGLHVVPFPNTPDAPPATQVILSSLTPDEIRSIRVVGSRSALHSGRLVQLPANRGTAFVPDKPFAAGETVTVTVQLDSPAAGTAEGAPNATRLRYSFTVRVPHPLLTHRLATNARAAKPSRPPLSFPRAAPTMSFHSQPDLKPPVLTTAGPDPDTASGDVFVTEDTESHRSPEILDSQGQLVWMDPLSGGPAFNLQVQSYEGQPMLTWWQGHPDGGSGLDGTDMIVNSSYQTVAALHAGYGYSSNLHEFTITPQNTALIAAYVPIRTNLSSVGGSRHGTVEDCVIQELDIRTGQVLWQWHALGHVPLSASYKKPTPGRAYSYFHLNSIQELPNGNLLISARNTWGIYEISRATGNIVWELGGKHSSFTMGRGTQLEWQHDAELNANGTLTVFDDAATPREEPQSSGKELRLNLHTMSASLVHRYTHSPPVLAGTMGSMQILPNGNVFIGWGSAPYFSEYTSGGKQIWSGRFGSYRAYRFVWNAQPTTPPAVAATTSPTGTTTVYASWNGATDVASWQVLAGATQTSMSPVTTAGRSGFESAITIPDGELYCAVQALSATGQVLGTSPTIAVPAA